MSRCRDGSSAHRGRAYRLEEQTRQLSLVRSPPDSILIGLSKASSVNAMLFSTPSSRSCSITSAPFEPPASHHIFYQRLRRAGNIFSFFRGTYQRSPATEKASLFHYFERPEDLFDLLHQRVFRAEIILLPEVAYRRIPRHENIAGSRFTFPVSIRRASSSRRRSRR